METPAIHRIIEQHAAVRGDVVAVAGNGHAMTYRQLNQRANLVARRLHDAGFRRGGHAIARMSRTTDLAIVLLAVLKAGGAYTWDDNVGHAAVSIAPTHVHPDHTRRSLCVETLLERGPHTCANLPIVTRGRDLACVLRDMAGEAAVLVPHAMVTSLATHVARGASARWVGAAGAMDLWFVLMAGGTAVLGEPAQAAA